MTADAQEPSMEDILASIRRILSEDEEGEAAPEAPAAAPAAEEPVPEVAAAPPAPAAPVEEEDPMAAAMAAEAMEEPAPDLAAIAAQEMEAPELAAAAAPAPDLAAPAAADSPVDLTGSMMVGGAAIPEPQMPAGDHLIDGAVAHASACSMAELVRIVSQDRNMGIGTGGLTLEELVRQLVRPFLKEWLDANLPYIVERIVKKEIAHVVDRADKL